MRIDNSIQETVARFGDLETWDWDDPGQNPPFDFCIDCWDELKLEFADVEIDHPPYEEGNYRCLRCNNPLFEFDNGYENPY